jgi:hypothetical protein
MCHTLQAAPEAPDRTLAYWQQFVATSTANVQAAAISSSNSSSSSVSNNSQHELQHEQQQHQQEQLKVHSTCELAVGIKQKCHWKKHISAGYLLKAVTEVLQQQQQQCCGVVSVAAGISSSCTHSTGGL